MFIVHVGMLASSRNTLRGSCSAWQNSASRSSDTARIAAVYLVTRDCRRGTSAGHTFGANQIRSTSASPVAVSAPRLKLSFKSGGVSVPSE